MVTCRVELVGLYRDAAVFAQERDGAVLGAGRHRRLDVHAADVVLQLGVCDGQVLYQVVVDVTGRVEVVSPDRLAADVANECDRTLVLAGRQDGHNIVTPEVVLQIVVRTGQKTCQHIVVMTGRLDRLGREQRAADGTEAAQFTVDRAGGGRQDAFVAEVIVRIAVMVVDRERFRFQRLAASAADSRLHTGMIHGCFLRDLRDRIVAERLDLVRFEPVVADLAVIVDTSGVLTGRFFRFGVHDVFVDFALLDRSLDSLVDAAEVIGVGLHRVTFRAVILRFPRFGAGRFLDDDLHGVVVCILPRRVIGLKDITAVVADLLLFAVFLGQTVRRLDDIPMPVRVLAFCAREQRAAGDQQCERQDDRQHFCVIAVFHLFPSFPFFGFYDLKNPDFTLSYLSKKSKRFFSLFTRFLFACHTASLRSSHGNRISASSLRFTFRSVWIIMEPEVFP